MSMVHNHFPEITQRTAKQNQKQRRAALEEKWKALQERSKDDFLEVDYIDENHYDTVDTVAAEPSSVAPPLDPLEEDEKYTVDVMTDVTHSVAVAKAAVKHVELRVTKSGYERTPNEIAGEAKAIARKEKNAKEKAVRHRNVRRLNKDLALKHNRKVKNVLREEPEHLPDHFTRVEQPVVEEVKKKVRSKKNPTGKVSSLYSKDQREAYRKARNAEKLRKKNAKREKRGRPRLGKPDIETESKDIETDETGSSFDYRWYHQWFVHQATGFGLTALSRYGFLDTGTPVYMAVLYFAQLLRSQSPIDDMLSTGQMFFGLHHVGRTEDITSHLTGALEVIKDYKNTSSSFARWVSSQPSISEKIRSSEFFKKEYKRFEDRYDQRGYGFGPMFESRKHAILRARDKRWRVDPDLNTTEWAKKASPPDADLEFKTESLSDTLSVLASGASLILNSRVIKAIRDVILALAGWKLFPKDVAKKCHTWFGKPKPMNVIDTLCEVLNSLSVVTRAGELMVSGTPFSTVLFENDPIMSVKSQTEQLLRYESAQYTGMPVLGFLCSREFVTRADNLVNGMDAILPKVGAFNEQRKVLEELKVRLLKARLASQLRLCGNRRATPFGIVVHGPPQVGKSSVILLMAQIYSRVKGREHDSSHIYERETSSEYWEGYSPYSNPIIHYSEVGSVAKDIASKKGDPVAKEVLSVVDCLPYRCNMAAVDDKGKVPCLADLVLIDTNNPGMNFEHVVNNCSAGWRRFLFIEVSVKEEFRKNGRNILDGSISSENFFDKWDYRVTIREPNGNTRYNEEVLLDFSDPNGYEKIVPLITTLLTRHITREEACNKDSQFVDFSMFDLAMDGEGEVYDVPEADQKDAIEANLVVEAGDLSPAYTFYDQSYAFIKRMGEIGYESSLMIALIFYQYLLMYFGYIVHLKFRFRAFFMVMVAAIAFFCGMLPYLLFAALAVLTQIDYAKERDVAIDDFMTESRRRILSPVVRLKQKYAELKGYLFGAFDVQNLFSTRSVIIMSACTAAVGSIIAYKKFMEKKPKPHAEASEFVVETPETKECNDTEKLYGCGSSYKRVRTKGTGFQWHNVMQPPPSVHTGGRKSLSDHVLRNTRRCRVVNADLPRETYCLGVRNDYALIHRHALRGKNRLTEIKVSVKGGIEEHDAYKNVNVEWNNAVMVTDDIALVRINEISFKDIMKHFPETVEPFTNARGMIQSEDIMVRAYSKPLEVDDGDEILTYQNTVYYEWGNHTPGMCGLPVVAERDIGSCIVGLHSAGSKKNSSCFAIVITRSMIDDAIAKHMEGDFLSPIYSESSIISTMKLYDPHPKSPFCYEDARRLDYYGYNGKVVHHSKSKQKRSCFTERALEDHFEEVYSHVRKTRYGRPVMKPFNGSDGWVSPYNRGLKKMAKDKVALDPRIMRKCIDVFTTQVLENLKDKDIPALQPLDLKVALNGYLEDYYVRKLDMKRAGGYGFKGKKLDHLIIVNDETKEYEPTPELLSEVNRLISCYENEEMGGIVFVAALKDEPRDVLKVSVGGTRIFYVTPFAYLLVQRMFMMPFYSLMVQYCDAFYTAIGIDMHREADRFYKRMNSFSDLHILVDYGGFDVSMPFDITRCSNQIAINLMLSLGYPRVAMKIVMGLMSDNLFPNVEMLGDVFCNPGMQPSGKYATAEDNSIKNVTIQLYTWYADPKLWDKNFFNYVLPCTYGDDSDAAIKEEILPYYNALTFAERTRQMGLEATSADKSGLDVPFSTSDQMEFLKRTFVYHPLLDKVVAPLSLDSIFKTLEWQMPSGSVNEITQMESICTSSLRELFFHCETVGKFNTSRTFILDTLKETYPQASFNLPMWEDINQSLCSTEKLVVKEGRPLEDIAISIVTESLALRGDLYPAHRFCLHLHGYQEDRDKHPLSPGRDTGCIIQRSATQLNTLEKLQARRDRATLDLDDVKNPYPGLSFNEVKTHPLIFRHGNAWDECVTFHKLSGEIEALDATIRTLKSQWRKRDMRRKNIFSISRSTEFVTESGELDSGPIDSSTVTNYGNLEDVGGLSPDMMSAGNSHDLDAGQVNKLDMGDFLSRPVEIAAFSVPVGDQINYNVEIWDAFLNVPAVRAKLRNFAFLRGDMRVRIAISGSPFHYGKVQVSYQPFGFHNSSLDVVSSLTGASRFARLCYLSQSPGVAVMDIRDNQPLDIVCPYINTQPMIRLFNKSPLVITDITSFDDAEHLGQLWITSINDVSAASGTPTDITVFVYAMMDNVQLGTPTGTVVQITTESKDLSDEREKGPIERFATRASQISDVLTVIPEIGVLAKASSKVFAGVGYVASLFGFSYPTMNNEPMRVRIQPYQNGANTIGYDTGKRITLDPKQELTVDPRVCGTTQDDMALSAICARESLLDTFVWDATDPPLTTAIWTVPVNPMLSRRIPLGAPTPYLVTPTALSYAATPFHYWRGDISFRFEVVCSQYHRGKVAILAEPNISQNVAIDASLDLNKQFIKVLDIQEVQDVTFTVEWMFSRAWARNMPNSLLGDIGGVGFLGDALYDYANGYIAVIPFTELQSPDGSNIEINVYIWSEDMQFNYMTSEFIPTVRPATESRSLDVNDDFSQMSLNESSANKQGLCELHFGELPVSFRGLLKRFQGPYASADMTVALSSNTSMGTVHPNWPPPSPAFDGIAGTTSLIGYLRYGFLGIRGGGKHRFNYLGPLTTRELESARAYLPIPSSTSLLSIFQNNFDDNYRCSMMGTITMVPNTNGSIEYEIPFYSNNLFGLSFSDDPFPSTNSNFDPVVLRNGVNRLNHSSTDTGDVHIDYSWAASEDFSLMRFQGGVPFQYG
jgi:hypothetical protein